MNKIIKYFVFGLFVLAAGGCSSGGDDDNSNTPSGIVYTAKFDSSPRPSWAIDWSSDTNAPNWQEPISEDFECSMDVLVTLYDDYLPYSTDNDVMAVFIGNQCRALSNRNVLEDGSVVYLLHIKGSSEEVDQPMELRFYCDKLHAMNITNAMPPFTPNNLMEEAYQLVLTLGDGCTKYPYFTELHVTMPTSQPFTVSNGDMLAVYVGDECRGIGIRNPELFEGWRMVVYSKQPNETAQIRYYSAEKGGIYTILKTFTLNNSLQKENIEF